MNVLQGNFYSTAFRVIDEAAFSNDEDVIKLGRQIEIFSGKMDGEVLHCITGKGQQPRTMLRVFRPAIMGLLQDAGPSRIPMVDSLGWIAVLQRHLHPDYGIIVINEDGAGSDFQTYITKECAGWTRQEN